MIRTPVCGLLGIAHPVFLGGMAAHTSATRGADIIVARGTEGGVHMDWMGCPPH